MQIMMEELWVGVFGGGYLNLANFVTTCEWPIVALLVWYNVFKCVPKGRMSLKQLVRLRRKSPRAHRQFRRAVSGEGPGKMIMGIEVNLTWRIKDLFKIVQLAERLAQRSAASGKCSITVEEGLERYCEDIHAMFCEHGVAFGTAKFSGLTTLQFHFAYLKLAIHEMDTVPAGERIFGLTGIAGRNAALRKLRLLKERVDAEMRNRAICAAVVDDLATELETEFKQGISIAAERV